MAERLKILFITSTGLVGSYLYKIFSEKKYSLTGSYHTFKEDNISYYVDIAEKSSLRKVFKEIAPAVVMLSASLTNVDYCEVNNDKAWQINVGGVNNTVQLCKEFNSKLVFFSSDYVFDGKNGPYSEEDRPCPVSFYGKTKLEGENIIRKNLENYLIIRTTVVYGNEQQKKNFAVRLINSLKRGNTVGVPCDQIGSPTYALNLAEIVEELVCKGKTGLYNVVGRDVMDRFNFALEICSEFGLDKHLITPVKTENLSQKAERPLKAGLKIDKLEREVDSKIRGVRESLKMLKGELGWTN